MLVDWLESRHEFPLFICHCTCEKDTSKDTLFDLWSFAHVLWGCVYSIPLYLWDEDFLSLLIMLTAAILYEFIENSSFGTKIAGMMCCTKNYEGDNFWNSVCDIMCCSLGFIIMYLARFNN